MCMAYAYVYLHMRTYVCMYAHVYVCMYECMLACVCSNGYIHRIFYIAYVWHTYSYSICCLFKHIHICMFVFLVLSTWHLRFHVHLQVVILVHFICAFTLYSASSNPGVLDCIRYKAFHICHVCNIHHYTYILHVCYSFVFHIQTLSAFALRFIH